MPDSTVAVPVGAERYALGEGPAWDERTGRALWVDIDAGEVWSAQWPDLGARRIEHRSLGHTPFVVLADDGGLLVGETNRLIAVRSDGTTIAGDPLFDVRAGLRRRRLNDAACDPQGRLLVGTLSTPDGDADELLLRIDPSGQVTTLRANLALSNGIGFSPSGAEMYHVDTLRRTVSTCDYRTADPTWTSEFVVADGYPDGLCVDAEGYLWVAIWGRSEMRRYSPGGRVTARIEVPATNVTSAAFVGPQLDSLLITTADADRPGNGHHAEIGGPHGQLYLADVEVPGAAVHRWHADSLPAGSPRA